MGLNRDRVAAVFRRIVGAVYAAHRLVDAALPRPGIGDPVRAPRDAAVPGLWTVVREHRPGEFVVAARCYTAGVADAIVVDAPLDTTVTVVPPWTLAR